jgi:hypothetical protein
MNQFKESSTWKSDSIYGKSEYLITQDPYLYENIKDIILDYNKLITQ